MPSLTASLATTPSDSAEAVSTPGIVELTRELETEPFCPYQWSPVALSTRRVGTDAIRSLRRSGRQSNRIAEFYERQNDAIDTLLAPIVEVDPAKTAAIARKIDFAVYGSMFANVLLFIIQVVVASTSGSPSLIAAALDSFMDLLSGLILSVTTWSAAKRNILLYPTGKKRFHTVGLMLFASCMSVLSVFLMVNSIQTLLKTDRLQTKVGIAQIAMVGIAIAAKVLLLIFCYAVRTSPCAQALVKDHRNDIIVNSFGFLMAILGSKLYLSGLDWLDPAGALLIALVILWSWISSAWGNILLIVGRSAPAEMLNRLTYIAVTHDPRILQIDTCKAYFVGHNIFVEIDIVLPPEMSLRESHDIGESLQKKLEIIENVERAFVHCDYEFDHRPEHLIV